MKSRENSTVNLPRPAPPTPLNMAVQALEQNQIPLDSQIRALLSSTAPQALGTALQWKSELDFSSTPESFSDNRRYDEHQLWLADKLPDKTPPLASLSSVSVDEQMKILSDPALAPSSTQEMQILPHKFDASQMVPDLMPLMFPSSDPFVYPTQPMSTLESECFSHDLSTTAMEFINAPPDSAIDLLDGYIPQTTIATLSRSPEMQLLPEDVCTRSAALFAQSQNLSTKSLNTSLPTEQPQRQSPDLVPLRRNFMWDGFEFPIQNIPNSHAMSQIPMSGANNAPINNIGLDGFAPMELSFDMDMNFDDDFR